MSHSNLEKIYVLRKKLEPFALELSVRNGNEAWEERVDRYRLHLHGQDLLAVIGHGEYRQLFDACTGRDTQEATRLAIDQLDQLHMNLLSRLPGASAENTETAIATKARKRSGSS